jgi:hypothetical protein
MPIEVSITTTVTDDAILFKDSTGGEDLYVISIFDSSKNIYVGIKVKDKSIVTFPTSAMVTIIDFPGLGAALKVM